MKTLLISNARVVNEGRQYDADLLIRNGRIDTIGADLQSRPADQAIDARGHLLLPGMIDDQVHFREPGLTHKAEIATESRAAVAGGITSFLEMPNTQPPTLSLEALEAKYQRAAQVSPANFGFYLGASNDNLDAIRRLPVGAACGVKVFMGASTGNMLVDDPKVLASIFAEAPVLIATHCEDTPLIRANEQAYREQYGEAVPMEMHPLIRSEEACWRSSSLAVELARQHNTRMHVLHLTTARELGLFEPGSHRDKRITVEACVHHLYFDAHDYAEKGSLIKCNPAIKQPEDRAALLAAVTEGRIDVIATDHAPHLLSEKDAPYFAAPAGLPLVQHALPSLFEHVRTGALTLETLVEKTSHAVADCFNIQGRGYIREGYWADLVLIDPNSPHAITRSEVLSKCGWSPFEGRTFSARVLATLVNGDVIWQNGALNPQATAGMRLEFGATR
ncbi:MULTISPECIES: dihydroorotase [Thiorhodovibrio]|uniref:dihydroorotase n=1 Tax=Thiorhodovibrio TaxID=61593 RepID=UPI001912BE79|nr:MULTISPECIES: dihydroorotase [Thiorhodovibrio]MBK5970809.1 dihydroorotase [Thiorhodovibrio winogradskyi]WPL10799.1 Dihydroorotase [Thiorhodovibrio litoralis]